MSSDTKREFIKWLAVFIFGLGLAIMLVVAAVLYRSTSFAGHLAHAVGHEVSENQRLAASLCVGLIAELLFMVTAYLLFPKKSYVK
jgi:hypothetical protein